MFQGGAVLALFGSFEVDLVQTPQTAPQSTLEAYGIFGSVEIRVPDHWKVEVDGKALFGAFANKTRGQREGDGPISELRVTGWALFGAVEVQSETADPKP